MNNKVFLRQISILRSQHQKTVMNASVLMVTRGGQIALGLLTTYVLANTLSMEKYGQYQFILSVIGIVSIFSLTEFANTLMQSVARGYRGSLRKMLPYPMLSSLIGSLTLVACAYLYGIKDDNTQIALCFIFAALFLPFTHGLRIWVGVKIGEEKFLDYSKTELLTLACTNIGIIGTVLLIPDKYIGAVLFVMLIPAIVNILMITRLLKLIPKDDAVESGVIGHGIKSSFYMAFSKVSNHIDKVLLFMFVDAVSVALLVAADRVSDLLRSAIQDLSTALAPEFAKTEAYTKKTDNFFKMSCLIFGVFMILFAFIALPHLLVLIYGEDYKEAIIYAQIFIVVLSISNLASFQFRYIRSKLDTQNVRNIMMVTSLSRIAMSLTFVPFMGLHGAVLSTVLYHLILTAMTDYRIRKDYLVA